MSEAQEGQAVLEDCSEQVFERFCQFAYTSDYQFVKEGEVVKPPSNDAIKTEDDEKKTQLKNASTELSTTQPAAASVSAAVSESTSSSAAMSRYSNVYSFASAELPKVPYGRYVRPRTKKKRKNPTNPWNIFLNEEYGKSDIPFEAPHIRRHVDNAYEIFICHAELYVFADRYDIPSLRDMTLFRIHEIFISFIHYPERLHEIVKLIEYVYESTSEPTSGSGSDRLRELMAHYVFTTLTEFMDNKEFVENLLGLQPFMKDLMNSVLKTQRLLEYRIGKC